MELLQNFYETTLDALKEAKNERLWFKTNTKLGKLYFDRGDFNKLQRILKQLHSSCQVSVEQKLCFVTFRWGLLAVSRISSLSPKIFRLSEIKHEDKKFFCAFYGMENIGGECKYCIIF